jgi:hypothetical protein
MSLTAIHGRLLRLFRMLLDRADRRNRLAQERLACKQNHPAGRRLRLVE